MRSICLWAALLLLQSVLAHWQPRGRTKPKTDSLGPIDGQLVFNIWVVIDTNIDMFAQRDPAFKTIFQS